MWLRQIPGTNFWVNLSVLKIEKNHLSGLWPYIQIIHQQIRSVKHHKHDIIYEQINVQVIIQTAICETHVHYDNTQENCIIMMYTNYEVK